VKERNEGERDDMPGFNSTNSQIHQKCKDVELKDASQSGFDAFIGGDGCLQVVENERMGGGGAASFLFQQI